MQARHDVPQNVNKPLHVTLKPKHVHIEKCVQRGTLRLETFFKHPQGNCIQYLLGLFQANDESKQHQSYDKFFEDYRPTICARIVSDNEGLS